MCAVQQSTVLPGEDQAEFDRRKASYFETYKPQSEAEKDQVEIIVNTTWRLKRIVRLESALFADENTDPLEALARITRYEGQLNRAHARALAHLKELQAARLEAARIAARERTAGSSVVRDSTDERTAGLSVVRDSTLEAARIAAQSTQRNEPKPAASQSLPLTPKDIHDYIMGPIPGFKEPSGGSR